jgi:cysteine desulfurase / selenocysteine lyase
VRLLHVSLSFLVWLPKSSLAFGPQGTALERRLSSRDDVRRLAAHETPLDDPGVVVAEDSSKVSLATLTRPDFPILHTTTNTNTHATTTTTTSDQPTQTPPALVYLDSAATAQKPTAVLQAMHDYYTTQNANVHRGSHYLSKQATAAYEAARETVAAFVHAKSSREIVICAGATEAINLVANSYGHRQQRVVVGTTTTTTTTAAAKGTTSSTASSSSSSSSWLFQPGDEIVVTVAEHHSNMVPWQLLAQRQNLVLRYVPTTPSGLWDIDAWTTEFLHPTRTKLVAVAQVSNVLGAIQNVTALVAAVRQYAPQAVVLLDACQSLPHGRVEVQSLGVDFLVASAHKFGGPTGVGFLWGREELLNQMPPWQGGGEMIQDVTLEGSTFQPAPARFEAGTPPIAQAIGMAAAIRYLENTVGMDRIEAYEHELAEYLYKRLAAVPGITILGPTDTTKRAALCSFYHATVHASDISAFLDMDGIAIRAGHHCCQPLHTELGYSHTARVSLYFYNTKEYVLACGKPAD